MMNMLINSGDEEMKKGENLQINGVAINVSIIIFPFCLPKRHGG